MRHIWLGAAICSFALMPAFAAQKPAPTNAKPAAKAQKMAQRAWAPQTLKGKIVSVDPARKLVIVKDEAGVPFDMRVTASTRIRANGQKLKLDGLKADAGKPVSVRYIPEGRGDMAQSIQLAG